ncbi:hypothetical protein PILCRDRAFT_823906 [Piloderma croceum F 1598]|uniref:Uncharacterized protein n=1 Tax=Piloderma croceum (strain F 1598) TaxID=765440 RepID=A0A0C3AYH8_PILCF|nr:hypothetical protein PILCRDRAFT_823906 [Piloderma croceum F 1598]
MTNDAIVREEKSTRPRKNRLRKTEICNSIRVGMPSTTADILKDPTPHCWIRVLAARAHDKAKQI